MKKWFYFYAQRVLTWLTFTVREVSAICSQFCTFKGIVLIFFFEVGLYGLLGHSQCICLQWMAVDVQQEYRCRKL